MAVFSRGREDDERPRSSQVALEAALKVSEIASSSRSLPEAMQSVVRTAIDILGADQSSLMLLDESGTDLVLSAAAGLPMGVPVGHRMPKGDGVAGRVLATGRPIRLNEVDGDRFVNFMPKDRPISSSLVAPLLAGGRSIGVLNVALAHPKSSFTDDDRRLAQMFADQVAGLIHRTRLHAEAERRSSDLSALVEASKGLLGAVDVDPTLQAVLDGAARLVGEQHGFVCLLDPQTGGVSRGVFRGIDKARIRAIVSSPEVSSASESEVPPMIVIEGGHYLTAAFRTSQGTQGLIVLTCSERTVSSRGYLLRAFAQQSGTAVGAAELYSMLQRKESEVGSIIQSVANPIVLADAARKIVTLNPSAESLFGISSAFCAGADVAGTLGQPEIEQILAGSGPLVAEVEVGVPPRYFKVRATDVRVPGAPVGRVLVMDDVTTEREMVQTQHDFVAMIGHELRTPLTIVKGFTKMLLKRHSTMDKEDAAEALTTIDAKANQLERLIEDLLYVSKIESREAKLKAENIAVHDLVHSVAAEVIPEYPGREVKIDISSDLRWLCDETKIALVIRHLLENALKYSEGPAPVLIRASEKDEELQIDVIDRGVGIVSSDLPHIFDRFRQIDGSSTRAHGGTGVGLYLCAQLVKVHGGKVWVDSTWGKGSTFSFSLPRQTATNPIVTLGSTADQRTA